MKFAESETSKRISLPLKGLVSVLIIGILALAVSKLSSPAPEIAIPSDLQTLEPQLQAYIKEQAAWVSQQPRASHRHATLGTIYAVNGLWNEARQQFETAMHLDPDQPLAFLYYGVALQETGDIELGIEQLNLVCRRFPGFPQGFARLGQAQLKVGAIDEAKRAFERLMLLSPKEWRGHTGLADCLLRQGQAQEALPHLDQALSLNPNIGIARHLRGLAYQRTGQADRAEVELAAGAGAVYFPMPDAWSATAPQHFRRLQDQFSAANDYIDAGQPDLALPILQRAARWHPENESLLSNLARAQTASDQPQEAKSTLEKLLALAPNNLAALVMACNVELDLGNPTGAEAFAQKALDHDPNAPPGHLAMATVFLNSNRIEAGLQAYQRALELDPQNPIIAMEIGDILIRMLRRPAEALEFFQKAIAIDPAFFPAQIRIADAFLRQNKPTEAAVALDQARALSPDAQVLKVLQERLDGLTKNPAP